MRNSDKSSAEAAKQVRDLEQARADIEPHPSGTGRAGRPHGDGKRSGRRQCRRNSRCPQQALAKVDDNRSLPKAVVTRLTAAEQAAAAAAKATLARWPAAAPDQIAAATRWRRRTVRRGAGSG